MDPSPTPPQPPQAPGRPRRRRWWISLAVVAVVIAGLVIALPAILGLRVAQDRILSDINAAFAPGKIQCERINLHWFQTTRLTSVQLFDPEGQVVATVPEAELNRTLWQLVLGDRSPFLLTLNQTALEVERDANGFNLGRALQAILAHPNPERDLTITIDQGRLRYRDPQLAEPVQADDVYLALRIPRAPNPVTWDLKLRKKEQTATLEIQGDFDRWLSRGGLQSAPELRVGVVGSRWPYSARFAEVNTTGQLNGTLEFTRKRGDWFCSGDTQLTQVNLKGKPLGGDVLTVDRVEAGWDLQQGQEGWRIRRLAVNSPLARIKAEGDLGTTGHQKLEGTLDLAALASSLPNTFRLREGLQVRSGMARVEVDLTSSDQKTTYDVDARLTDLVANLNNQLLSLREPARLSGRVIRTQGGDSRVESLSAETAFLKATASGRFEDGVILKGKLDLEALTRQFDDWVELDRWAMSGTLDFEGNYKVQAQPTPQFSNRIEAKGRGLVLTGMPGAVGPLKRDALAIQLQLDGPADNTGFPVGWSSSKLNVTSPDGKGGLELSRAAGSINLTGDYTSSLSVNGRSRPVRLAGSAQWQEKTSRLDLPRLDVQVGENAQGVSLQGWLDTRAGSLVVQPLGTDGGQTLGLRVTGFNQGINSLGVELELRGDASTSDAWLARALGRSPLGVEGVWTANASVRGTNEGPRFSGRLQLDSSTMKDRAQTAELSLSGRYLSEADRVELNEMSLRSEYLTIDASGSVESVKAERVLGLKGRVAPNFEALTRVLASSVEPRSKISGKPRTFELTGRLDDLGDWRRVEGEFGVDLTELDIYGMKFGACPLTVKLKGGKPIIVPVETTLNGGHVRLEPELDLDAEGGPMLRLGKNSTIRDAEINDEVSRRVLTFAAPILDQATRVSGFVTVDLDHAEFPLGAGRGRQTKVEGAVVFEDVEFAPGPLANEILGAMGRGDLVLQLDRPVTLTIADGRINQRGMSLPVGELTRVELTGWVDFDRNLSMIAEIPVTGALVGNNPLLSDIVSGTKVRLPIVGTLDKPKVDKEALASNLKDLGGSLAVRGATRGVLELLMRAGQGRDKPANPNPPQPRMTPQERKALRLEKRATRRGETNPAPPPPAPGELPRSE